MRPARYATTPEVYLRAQIDEDADGALFYDIRGTIGRRLCHIRHGTSACEMLDDLGAGSVPGDVSQMLCNFAAVVAAIHTLYPHAASIGKITLETPCHGVPVFANKAPSADSTRQFALACRTLRDAVARLRTRCADVRFETRAK